MKMIPLLSLLLVSSCGHHAYAEDSRCEVLRAMQARGEAANYTRAQVAQATLWYRANCGHRTRSAER